MRSTIAHKKHSVGFLYIGLTVFFVPTALCLFFAGMVPAGIVAALTAIISAVVSVMYLVLPSDIIILSDDSIILPKGVTVRLIDVYHVSYKRARARGMRYRWGCVTVSANSGVYKIRFVADCEDVSKVLTRLVSEAKSGK